MAGWVLLLGVMVTLMVAMVVAAV
jgi:hypothetical protein